MPEIKVPSEADTIADAMGLSITPDMSGSVHGSDDTTAVLRARDRAVSQGCALVLPRGTYTINQTLDLPSNTSLFLMPGARLKAKSTFSSASLVRLGDPNDASFAERIFVGGGGIIDADNKCDIGIDAANVRFSKIRDLEIIGSNLKGIRVGDPASAKASYEVDISGAKVFYNDIANAVGSRGFSHENATDCYISQSQSIGYRTGFHNGLNSSSIDYTQTHCWVRPVHGVMNRGFDVQGSTCTLLGCYADTPTNYGDVSQTDLSCFFLHGNNPVLIGCRAFMNTNYPGTDISTDNLVSVIKMDREPFGTIYGLQVRGSTALRRWKMLMDGGFTVGTSIDALDASEQYGTGGSTSRYFRNVLSLSQATTTTLPSASTRPSGIMAVTNPAAGKGRVIYSDGTSWRYVSDDSAV